MANGNLPITAAQYTPNPLLPIQAFSEGARVGAQTSPVASFLGGFTSGINKGLTYLQNQERNRLQKERNKYAEELTKQQANLAKTRADVAVETINLSKDKFFDKKKQDALKYGIDQQRIKNETTEVYLKSLETNYKLREKGNNSASAAALMRIANNANQGDYEELLNFANQPSQDIVKTVNNAAKQSSGTVEALKNETNKLLANENISEKDVPKLKNLLVAAEKVGKAAILSPNVQGPSMQTVMDEFHWEDFNKVRKLARKNITIDEHPSDINKIKVTFGDEEESITGSYDIKNKQVRNSIRAIAAEAASWNRRNPQPPLTQEEELQRNMQLFETMLNRFGLTLEDLQTESKKKKATKKLKSKEDIDVEGGSSLISPKEAKELLAPKVTAQESKDRVYNALGL